jgi:hypothetical protein
VKGGVPAPEPLGLAPLAYGGVKGLYCPRVHLAQRRVAQKLAAQLQALLVLRYAVFRCLPGGAPRLAERGHKLQEAHFPAVRPQAVVESPAYIVANLAGLCLRAVHYARHALALARRGIVASRHRHAPNAAPEFLDAAIAFRHINSPPLSALRSHLFQTP